MNDYSVKDFMKTVFNPFDKSLNKNNLNDALMTSIAGISAAIKNTG